MKNSLMMRRMELPDVELALNWAAAEGWNPGLHDASCFFAADPQGFFMGEVAGEPAGCISTVAYGSDFGFLGLYIMRPEFRGRGYGIQLWRMAMEYMGLRNVGLDGVPAQQGNYEKSGFRLAYRNIRWEGTGVAARQSRRVATELAAVSFEGIAGYDAELFTCRRDRFLRCWIEQPGGAALGVVDGGRLAGYGVIRGCRRGFKIGPLFADTELIAEDLYAALCGRVPGKPVFLDTPEPNAAAVALARRHGMEPVFETARMYTKGDPGLPVARIFGVTTFELG